MKKTTILGYIRLTMRNCLNCNYPVTEGQNFCSHCGQRADLKRLHLHEIWHDLIHYFTHADKGIFQLLKALSIQTGTVAREFVAGKRKKYFPPLNFFLIVAALYVFMNSIFSYTPSSVKPNTTQTAYSKQTTAPSYNIDQQRKMAPVNRFFAKYSNFVAMFAAPFISLLLWLILLKGPYNYTEHLVANLYLIGFTNLVRCMIYIPALSLLHISPATKSVNYIFVLFEIAYRTVFYYRFMGEFSVKGKIKSLALAIYTAIAWWLLIFGFIFAYMTIITT